MLIKYQLMWIRHNKMVKRKIVKSKKAVRYPNLSTILMVESFLKKKSDVPIKISELKRKLPKQVMHKTLQIILEYLLIS